MKRLTFASTTLILAATAAHADTPPPPLPLSVLIDAAQTALASCSANGYHVTVTIMDADLSTRLVLRSDGAPDRTVEIGRRKAYTVVKTGMSSRDFGASQQPATGSPPPPSPPPPNSGPPPMPGPVNGDASLITWAGGLPIRVNGQLVGSMSASGAPGGEKDEACVNAGLVKIAQGSK